MDARPRAALTQRRLERGGLALLVVAALALWRHVDVDPTFDSLWSLLWGRELSRGGLPTFEAYRAPTEHPLWVAVSTVLAPLGEHAAPRALTLLTVLSWVATLAGLYRLGRATFGAVAGAVAVVILATRLDFPFWAALGFVDVPYLALLVWAAALEAERPRRGGAVWAALVLAGLLRPEAWVFAVVYAVWLGWRAPWAARARLAGWVALPMVLWAALDLAVTGDPLYSFTMSTDHAAQLGRSRSLLDLPRSTLASANELLKPPFVVLGVLGIGAALALRRPRELRVPLAVLGIGLVGFLVVSASGFSVIPRYFATPALVLALFAAVALTGWTALPAARLRTAWAGAAVVLAVAGGAWQATRLHPASVEADLAYRADVVDALRDALRTPAVRDGLACGPISVPNHLLQPHVAWHLDVPVERVVARTDHTPPRGVALLTLTSRLNKHPAFGVLNARLHDPISALLPPAGYERAAFAELYSTYAAC